jgi:predicted RNA-binding protein with TRAM domain
MEMKKIGMIFSSFLIVGMLLSGCGNGNGNVKPDYTTKQFEEALNKGEKLEGKTVSVEVDKMVPNSAFGYNIQTGKHLNFVSTENPDVKKGDKVVLKVEKVESALGSFIISYEKQ